MFENVAGMKCLVTGGAGFIGSNLIKLLLENKCIVSVLDNLFSGFRENLESFPNIQFIHGDIRDARLVKDAMDGIDVVFHQASSVGNSRSIENPVRDSEINVIGTLNILEAAKERQV